MNEVEILTISATTLTSPVHSPHTVEKALPFRFVIKFHFTKFSQNILTED